MLQHPTKLAQVAVQIGRKKNSIDGYSPVGACSQANFRPHKTHVLDAELPDACTLKKVFFTLMPDGQDRHRLFVFDLEQRHIAGGSKRNNQLP